MADDVSAPVYTGLLPSMAGHRPSQQSPVGSAPPRPQRGRRATSTLAHRCASGSTRVVSGQRDLGSVNSVIQRCILYSYTAYTLYSTIQSPSVHYLGEYLLIVSLVPRSMSCDWYSDMTDLMHRSILYIRGGIHPRHHQMAPISLSTKLPS